MFGKRVGTHIATVKIDNNEGIASEPDNKGHFTFHEYEHTNLKDKITDIERLTE